MALPPVSDASIQPSFVGPDFSLPQALAQNFNCLDWLRLPENDQILRSISAVSDAFLNAVTIPGTNESGLILALRDLCILSFQLHRYVVSEVAKNFQLNSSQEMQFSNLVRNNLDAAVKDVFASYVRADAKVQKANDGRYFNNSRNLPPAQTLVTLIIDDELNGVLEPAYKKTAHGLYKAGSSCVVERDGQFQIQSAEFEYTDESLLIQGLAKNVDCSDNPELCLGGGIVAAVFPPSIFLMGIVGMASGVDTIITASDGVNSQDPVLKSIAFQGISQGTSSLGFGVLAVRGGFQSNRIPLGHEEPYSFLPAPLPPNRIGPTRPTRTPPGLIASTEPSPVAPVIPAEIVVAQTEARFSRNSGSGSDLVYADVVEPKPTLLKQNTELYDLFLPQEDSLPVLAVPRYRISSDLSPVSGSHYIGMPDGYDPIAYAASICAIEDEDEDEDDDDDDDSKLPGDAYLGSDAPDAHAEAWAAISTSRSKAAQDWDYDGALQFAPGQSLDDPIDVTTPDLGEVSTLQKDLRAFKGQTLFLELTMPQNFKTMSDLELRAAEIVNLDPMIGDILLRKNVKNAAQEITGGVRTLRQAANMHPNHPVQLRIVCFDESEIATISMTWSQGKPKFEIVIPRTKVSAGNLADVLIVLCDAIRDNVYNDQSLESLFQNRQITINAGSAEPAIKGQMVRIQKAPRYARVDQDDDDDDDDDGFSEGLYSGDILGANGLALSGHSSASPMPTPTVILKALQGTLSNLGDN